MSSRAKHLRQRYRLTPDAFERMVVEQGGACAICGAEVPLHVDHCHATGRVRALLCNHCNCALGQLREDPGIARAVAEYLERHAG